MLEIPVKATSHLATRHSNGRARMNLQSRLHASQALNIAPKSTKNFKANAGGRLTESTKKHKPTKTNRQMLSEEPGVFLGPLHKYSLKSFSNG